MDRHIRNILRVIFDIEQSFMTVMIEYHGGKVEYIDRESVTSRVVSDDVPFQDLPEGTQACDCGECGVSHYQGESISEIVGHDYAALGERLLAFYDSQENIDMSELKVPGERFERLYGYDRAFLDLDASFIFKLEAMPRREPNLPTAEPAPHGYRAAVKSAQWKNRQRHMPSRIGRWKR